MLKNFILVAIGGAIGSMLRFGMFNLIKQHQFPWATFIVNMAGSFVIGFLLGHAIKDIRFENNWKIFLSTGICGGFTTFSAFSLENLQMLQQGKYFLSAFYIVTSLLGGIVAAWLGFKLAIN